MDAEQQSLRESFRNALLAHCVQRSGSSLHAEAEVAALFREQSKDRGGEMALTPQGFGAVVQATPSLHNLFNGPRLGSLFAALDVNKNGYITMTQLNEILSSDVSRARTTAIRLKKSLSQKLQTAEKIEELFEEAAHGANFLNPAQFRHVVAVGLDVDATESELMGMYQVFDVDGDGKVTLNDLEDAITNQAFDVTERVLSPINPRAIVDIQISTTARQEEELLSRGYTLLKPDTDEFEGTGSFGHSAGVWIRRKADGDADARLSPIVDLLLEPQRASTSLVLGRYLCNTRAIKGQYLWFRRAQTQAEAETSAIIDLKITMGKMKDATNVIWASPAVGWIRVDGNFNKGYLGGPDAFLWILPVNPRNDGSKMVSPLKGVVTMQPEARLAELVEAVRQALRKFIPVAELKKRSVTREQAGSAPAYDFCSLFSEHDSDRHMTVSLQEFGQMLVQVGACVDKSDVRAIFHQFDWHQQSAVAQADFTSMLSLTPAEIDQMLQAAKVRLRGQDKPPQRQASAKSLSSRKVEAARANESNGGFKTELMRNRVLLNVFRCINLDNDGLLSASELAYMFERLEFFVTAAEVQRVQQILDHDGSGRIEESDFITFMNAPNNVTKSSAMRVRNAAITFRHWALQVRSPDRTAKAVDGLDSETPWLQLKRRHEANGGSKFPDYISPTDLAFSLNHLGVRLHSTEARHLSFVMAPKKQGRVHQKDWHWFLQSSCRTFGELGAMFERALLPDLVVAARRARTSQGDEQAVEALEEQMTAILNVIRKSGDASASAPRQHDNHKKQCFVPISQLRLGIAEFGNFDAQQGPNLEEYANLALYCDGVELVDGQYTVDADRFMRALIDDILSPPTGTQPAAVAAASASGSNDQAARQLRSMIKAEARHHTRRGKCDYTVPFALFDQDGNGIVPLAEFQTTLDRLMPKAFDADGTKEIMHVFDQTGKGFITLDDFVAFAEAGDDDSQYGYGSDVDDLASTDDEHEANLRQARQPPTAVTRNHQCDAFMWVLWKACSAANPSNPQQIVYELADICRDNEGREHTAGLVPLKSLWTALQEANVQTGLTKRQFKDGVAFLTNESGLVDYDTLIRGTIQMGKAESAREEQLNAIDEPTFQACLTKLQHSADTTDKSSQWEAALARADTNSDGAVTMEEFKKVAKARGLNFGNTTTRFVRRLFKIIDSQNHGVVAISRLLEVICNEGGDDADSVSSASFSSEHDSLDGIFNASDSLTREGVFAKLRTLIQPGVPLSRAASKVERHFRKLDKSNTKMIPENKFREFLDRSHITKQMSKTEIDLLCRILRQPTGKGKKQIDYEAFCDSVFGGVREPFQSSEDAQKMELVNKFRSAATASSTNRRPFTALASLFDPNDTGFINLEDLQQTSKMMGFPINKSEATTLIKTLGPSADGRSIPYRELEDVVLYAREGDTMRAHDLAAPRALRMSAAFGQSRHPYPAPTTTDMLYTSSGHPLFPRPSSAPSGFRAPSPVRGRSADFGDMFLPSGSIQDLYTKVRHALQRSPHVAADQRSLAQRFMHYDPQRTGFVRFASFIEELERMGVPLMPHDLGEVRKYFGRPNDDFVDYQAFVDGATADGTGRFDHDHDMDGSDAILQNPRLVERVRTLLSEQQNIVMCFDQVCQDQSGLLNVQEFVQAARNLQLPISMACVNTLRRQYGSVVEPDKICYEDVVRDMIAAAGRPSSAFSLNRTNVSAQNDLLRSSFSAAEVRPPLPANTPVFRSREFDSTFSSLRDFQGQLQDDFASSQLQPTAWRSSRQRPELNVPASFSGRPLTATKSPSSPPRKVGAMMWGKDTELAEKGRAPGILGRN